MPRRLLPRRGAISTRPRPCCCRFRRGWSRSAASAAAALRAGYSAVIDAVALREQERHSFAAVAAAAGVPFTGLWLDAPAETMRTRIAGRRGDASDASSEILSHQLAHNPSALDWIGIDAGGDPEATLAAARRAMVH